MSYENTKIYAIVNKATGEFKSYNGRVAWSKYGNAKNAFDRSLLHFNNNNFDNYYNKIYEIVELTKYYGDFHNVPDDETRKRIE